MEKLQKTTDIPGKFVFKLVTRESSHFNGEIQTTFNKISFRSKLIFLNNGYVAY